MDKLHKIIEQIIEVKIDKPFNPKEIIKLFNDDPIFFDSIGIYNNFEELNNDFGFEEEYIAKKEKEFNTIKPLHNSNQIKCISIDSVHKIKKYDISLYKNLYLIDDDDVTYALLTKF
jgi:hypothetical protein